MLVVSQELLNILDRSGIPYQELTSYSPYGWSNPTNAELSIDFSTGFLILQELGEDKKPIIGKPTSILRKAIYPVFADSLPDTFFEAVANNIRAHVESNKASIEIWPASRISEACLEDNNAQDVDTGSLRSSCMRYDFCEDFMTFYTEIDKHNGGDFVQIAVLVRDLDGAVLGRALVWNLTDGRTVMDRAYGTESTQTLFENYARERGWYKRKLNTYHSKTIWIAPDGQFVRESIKIPIPRSSRMVFDVPYIDTFSYMDVEEAVLHNNNHWSVDATLKGTEGDTFVHDSFSDRYGLESTPENVLHVLKNKLRPKVTTTENSQDIQEKDSDQDRPLHSFAFDDVSHYISWRRI